MVFRVELTARAERDLRYLYEHTQAADSERAASWFNGLESLILSLARHPRRGRVTREDKTLYQVVFGNKPHVYRVIYEVIDRTKTVEVLHIRHGARDAFVKGDIQ